MRSKPEHSDCSASTPIRNSEERRLAVYVDRIRTHGNVKGRADRVGNRWSHLFADTPEELDAFAASIGMHYEWGQHRGVPGKYHYDVPPFRREMAVAAGAQEVDDRTMIAIFRKQKEPAKNDRTEDPAE
jgi:Protein of unknown function (DUF4031)